MQQVATQEAVDHAANQLVADGKEPSVRSVQEITKGSFTTIKKFLRDWEQRRRAPESAVQVPEELLAMSRSLVTQIYACCLATGQAEIDAIRRDAAATAARQAGELHEAMGELQSLEDEITQHERTQGSLKGDLALKEAENTRLKVEVARLEERVTNQGDRIRELHAALLAKQELEARLAELERRIQQSDGGDATGTGR